MKVFTELKEVISLEFYSDCVLLGYRNDGLCTLIRKYNFSFIYPIISFSKCISNF